MTRRTKYRLLDIKEAIDNIHELLDGLAFEEMYADVAIKAAFERFLEIASEAARNLPGALTDRHPEVPWRNVADLGNVLRHSYHKSDARALWTIYESELGALEKAVASMLDEVADDES